MGYDYSPIIIDHIDHRAIGEFLTASLEDIADTMEQYAHAAFDEFNADAVTVDVYGGWDTVEPMLVDPRAACSCGAAAAIRTRTPFRGVRGTRIPCSCASAGETFSHGRRWANLGMVVGATRAGDVRRVRAAAPTVPLLAPGVGAKAATWNRSCGTASARRSAGVLINAGRSALWGIGRRRLCARDARAPCSSCAPASTQCGRRDRGRRRPTFRSSRSERTVRMRKAHPCGVDTWTVTRVGGDGRGSGVERPAVAESSWHGASWRAASIPGPALGLRTPASRPAPGLSARRPSTRASTLVVGQLVERLLHVRCRPGGPVNSRKNR